MPSGKNRPSAGLSRREALRFLGSASALPLVYPAISHHRYEVPTTPAPPAWKPRFLAPEAVETVVSLSECIISRAEAPGASDTSVVDYIDSALARSEPAVQVAFYEGLSWLEEYARRSMGMRFIELDRDRQHRLLAEISDTSRAHEPKGYAFLTLIKQLTIEGYYRADSDPSA